MTKNTDTAGAGTPISPKSSVLHACVRAAWQYGHRDRSELTDGERYDRADYYATNALRVWGLTNIKEDDLTGPAAWRHQLPDGATFIDGRSSKVLESLQEALASMDQFGGLIEPLFKLASAGNTDTWKNEGRQS